MASHDLDDGDRSLLIDRGIKNDLADSGSNIFCSASESGGVVREDKVVIDRFWNPNEFHTASDFFRVAGELVHGIHGVISAHVEKVTDVHLAEVVKDRRINFAF